VPLAPPGLRQTRQGRPAPALVRGWFTSRPNPRVGLRPTVRFVIAFALTAGWVAFAVWASGPWRSDLEDALGPVLAWVIPTLLGYIPGFVIGLMAFTLLITRYREPPSVATWPDVTVIVAAWNEEDGIVPTFERIAALDYPGHVEVVLADNNSTDRTAELAKATAARLGLEYRRVFEPMPGKHRALNAVLPSVATLVVVTVDADTLLQQEALQRLIARLLDAPQGQHVSACAGALVAGNPRANGVTRMQQWDYRLGINGVKRMQAAYNSALVAQGAFSAYWTDDVRAVGGWPDAIGEDIVLTWAMMSNRGVVQYEPVALGFTTVPEKLGRLLTQRSRWARGMFEGLRMHPPPKQPRVLAKLVASIDYLVPFLDIGLMFFFLPGVILLALGYPLIVGWWSILLLPITLAIFGFLRWWQERHVFKRLDIDPGRDTRGFIGYLAVYPFLTSAAAIRGYGQYFIGATRRWK
jgi:biofilm PGA synthesis N-glycosyltransferase PgaC